MKRNRERYTEPKGEGIRLICFRDLATGQVTHPKRRYRAERWETVDGVEKRKHRCFQVHSDAKAWRLAGHVVVTTPKEAMQFRTAFHLFVEAELNLGAESSARTRLSRRRHLKFFMRPSVRMDENFNPELIDRWLKRIRDPRYLACQHKTRTTYREEFKLLRLVLSFYRETYDLRFPLPLLRRHRKNLVVRAKPQEVKKDLTVEEYGAWIHALGGLVDRAMDRIWQAGTDNGVRYYYEKWQILRRVHVIAKLQYPLVGRGQDIPALHLEDMNPIGQEVTLRRRVVWIRSAGGEAHVLEGLKNNEIKIIPSPTACRIMQEWALEEGITKGPLFFWKGKPLSYRQLQHWYGEGFKAAGLQKSGTHVVRHGAGQEVHLAAGGDIKQAQKALGHKSLRTTEGYVGVRDVDFKKSLTRMDERLQSIKR